MNKIFLKVLVIFIGLGLMTCLLSACGLKAKAYVDERARVDQQLPAGDPEVNSPNRKKTRQVLVMEVTKEKQPVAVHKEKSMAEEPTTAVAASGHVEKTAPTQNFNTNEMPGESENLPSLPAQYTVLKDDTLQKISKKFYGSFSRWTKIYDANKDKIDDPERIKSGITITIPVLE